MDSQTHIVPPIAIVVPLLACLTVILDIGPFIWHVKHRNLAAACLVFWVVLGNLFDGINALIWPTNDISNWWPGFGLCDIEVKLMLATTVGIPGSLVCIMRNLALVLDTKRSCPIPTQAQRRRQFAIDFVLCIGLSIYMMAIHYVVQPTRYYIFQIAGCLTSYDDSWPTIVLMWIWPSILCLVAVYYSIMVIVRMRKYQKDFSGILNSSNSNLTKSRFKRLFFLSMTLVAVVLPVQFYVLYQNASYPQIPYDWNAIHGPDWLDIIMVPTGGEVYYDHWIHIAVGFAIFIFFGLGRDALTMYRGWLLKAGLGSIFPGLQKGSRKPSTFSTITTSATEASFSSRARMYLSKRFSAESFATTLNSKTNSPCPSPKDPQKAFPSLATITERHESSPRPEASTRAQPANDEQDVFPTAPSPHAQSPLFGRFLAAIRNGSSSLLLPTTRRPPGCAV